MSIREIDPLGVLSTPPTVQAQHLFVAVLGYASKAKHPILDQDAIASLHVIHEMRVRSTGPAVAAFDWFALNNELFASGDRHAAAAAFVGNLSKPDFGPHRSPRMAMGSFQRIAASRMLQSIRECSLSEP